MRIRWQTIMYGRLRLAVLRCCYDTHTPEMALYIIAIRCRYWIDTAVYGVDTASIRPYCHSIRLCILLQ